MGQLIGCVHFAPGVTGRQKTTKRSFLRILKKEPSSLTGWALGK